MFVLRAFRFWYFVVGLFDWFGVLVLRLLVDCWLGLLLVCLVVFEFGLDGGLDLVLRV